MDEKKGKGERNQKRQRTCRQSSPHPQEQRSNDNGKAKKQASIHGEGFQGILPKA